MDFEDTPEEADFRAEVRAWLAKTAPAYSGGVGGLMRSVRSPEELAKAKQWQAQKAEALCQDHVAQGIWRHGWHADPECDLCPGRSKI